MAIAKKPRSNQKAVVSQNDENAAQAFISGAGKGTEEEAKKPVMVRFDPALLTRVDAAAKRRGISRSAWIQYTLSRALDQGEG
jgi:predicted HicB family RNase H-like nuclease